MARFTGFCCSARCPRAWRVGSLSSSKGQNNLSLMLKRGIGVLAGAALVVALLAATPRQIANGVERTLPDEVAVAAVPVVRSLAADSSRRSLLAILSGASAMALLATSGLVESIVTDDQYSVLVLAIIRAASRKSRYRPVYGGRAYASPIARSRHRRLLRTRNRGAGRPPRNPTVSGARQSQVREGASTER